MLGLVVVCFVSSLRLGFTVFFLFPVDTSPRIEDYPGFVPFFFILFLVFVDSGVLLPLSFYPYYSSRFNLGNISSLCDFSLLVVYDEREPVYAAISIYGDSCCPLISTAFTQ